MLPPATDESLPPLGILHVCVSVCVFLFLPHQNILSTCKKDFFLEVGTFFAGSNNLKCFFQSWDLDLRSGLELGLGWGHG